MPTKTLSISITKSLISIFEFLIFLCKRIFLFANNLYFQFEKFYISEVLFSNIFFKSSKCQNISSNITIKIVTWELKTILATGENLPRQWLML